MTAPSLLDELEGVVRLADRLDQLSTAVAEQRWNELSMRVPAEPDRDADLVLASVAHFIRTRYAEIADMAKRLEAAERDAARYRWLRNQATTGVMTTPCHGSLNCDEPESEWDAWIDAAAQEGEG